MRDSTRGDELDTLGRVLPLPFRVALIIVLGVWAWGANLHYLSLIKIDVPALIRYPPRPSVHHPSHHLSTYRLASVLSIFLGSTLVLFWLVTHGDPDLVARWELLPNLYLLIIVIIFLIPLPMFSRSGRARFLTTLRRIGIGGIAENHDGRFGDILMADALTSYARVIGDLFISLCMFVSRGRSSTGKPDRLCGGQFLVPLIVAVPSMIRLRQCLIEFGRAWRAQHGQRGGGGHGWGGQHLANALKYSTAFPVLIMAALQRGYRAEDMGMSETGLFRLWLFFVLVNSGYSLYWDVAKDWDLTLFSSDRESPDYPYGLRRHRFFHNKNIYYCAIALDVVLRCTWTLKLSARLDRWNDRESGIFAMQILEVFRRWVWIFFRVETEWVRTNRGPNLDDVLLGDMGGKMDED